MSLNSTKNTVEYCSKTMNEIITSFHIMVSSLKDIYSDCPQGEYLKIQLDKKFDIQLAKKYFSDNNNILYIFENKPQISLEPGQHFCIVCYSELPHTKLIHPDCGHPICDECCTSHCEHQISLGPTKKLIKCGKEYCNYYFSMTTIEKMVSEDSFKKFKNYWCADFIDCRKNLFYCKSKYSCNYIVEILHVPEDMKVIPAISMQCDCGYNGCLGCNQIGHDPLDCDLFIKWSSKLSGNLDEQKDMQWIKENSKPCPGCKTPIDKNGGCMHMTCRKCKFEFCWICMDDYFKHTSCQDPQLIAKQNELQASGKEDQAKQIIYLNKFQEHIIGAQLNQDSKRLQDSCFQFFQTILLDKKYECLFWDNTFNFYTTAMLFVIQSRYFIACTFPLSCQITNEETMNLFIFNQSSLTDSLEILDKKLEENPFWSLFDFQPKTALKYF